MPLAFISFGPEVHAETILFRAKCPRTTLATSISTFRPCCLLAPRTYPVSIVLSSGARTGNVGSDHALLDDIVDKGTAKLARQLGFDYAEAVVRALPLSFPSTIFVDLVPRAEEAWVAVTVIRSSCPSACATSDVFLPIQTGFEFKKRRAFPVITGVVVAAENESALLEVRVCPVRERGVCQRLRHVLTQCIAQRSAPAPASCIARSVSFVHTGILGSRATRRSQTPRKAAGAGDQALDEARAGSPHPPATARAICRPRRCARHHGAADRCRRSRSG